MAKVKVLVAGLACVLSHHAALSQQYEYLNLGTGFVSAINNAGQAVGSLYNGSGVQKAVVWDQGTPTFLSALGGTSSAAAINSTGQIAGQSWTTGLAAKAVVWSTGSITTLASNAKYASGDAVGINDNGLVVGNASEYYGGPSQAVVWSGFNLIPLTNAGGSSSVVTGINNSGSITGYVNGYPGTENPQAVVWQGNSVTVLPNLRPNNGYSIAHAINEDGVVVGDASDASSDLHAVVWRDGVLSTLGRLSSADRAFDINDLGIVVGAMNASGGAVRAALWDTKTNQGVDLNKLLAPGVLPAEITLVAAYGINNAGDIVGQAYNSKTGSLGAFELRAVPEASTLMMWSIGLVGLFMSRRRRTSVGA